MKKETIEIVQVTTQILGILIAAIMAYLAWRTYLKKPQQESEPSIAEDKEAKVGPIRELVVFDTSKQQTTLLATSQGIECYLENKKQSQKEKQWTLSKNDCMGVLKRKNYNVNPGYKANTGLFSIGHRTNWLYSKKLFPVKGSKGVTH